jgi:hypothetical protein
VITTQRQYAPRWSTFRNDAHQVVVGCVIVREGRTFFGSARIYAPRDVRNCLAGSIPMWAKTAAYWAAIAASARWTFANPPPVRHVEHAPKAAPQVDMSVLRRRVEVCA